MDRFRSGTGGAPPEIDDPALAGVARELEAYAREATPAVPAGLSDRIVAALEREPIPSPLGDVVRALVPTGWRSLPATLRGVARLAAGAGRPVALALRMEALAVLVALALLVLGGGTLAAVGAQAVFNAVTGPRAPRATPLVPRPSPSMTPTPSFALPSAAPTALPTVPAPVSAEPAETSPPEGGESPVAGPTPRPSSETGMPRASSASGNPERAARTATPEPRDSPEPGSDGGSTDGGASATPDTSGQSGLPGPTPTPTAGEGGS